MTILTSRQSALRMLLNRIIIANDNGHNPTRNEVINPDHAVPTQTQRRHAYMITQLIDKGLVQDVGIPAVRSALAATHAGRCEWQ